MILRQDARAGGGGGRPARTFCGCAVSAAPGVGGLRCGPPPVGAETGRPGGPAAPAPRAPHNALGARRPGRAGAGWPLAPSNETARPRVPTSPPGQGGLCADAADPGSAAANPFRLKARAGWGLAAWEPGAGWGSRGAFGRGPSGVPLLRDRVISPAGVARARAFPRQGT